MKTKINKLIPFVLAAVTILLLGACTQNADTTESTTKPNAAQTTATPAAQYKKITTAEAKALMDAGNVIVLDVRTQEEFALGHIKDAILLPDIEVGAKAATILPDKTAKILVYCRSGRRSALAAKELISMGYTDVLDFGGMETDWPYEIVT